MVRALVDGGPTFRRICRAIDEAHHSVWLSAAFFSPEFQMPGGRGSVLQVLDRAGRRGLDVRVLFWRPNFDVSSRGRVFAGAAEDHELLENNSSAISARWDRTQGRYCHHQKFWLIDAGQSHELAFVGGSNLTPGNEGEPGHGGKNQRHDIYAELSGPSTTDVHHNFVQRWNGASERFLSDGVYGPVGKDDLVYPQRVSSAAGDQLVQIQRNMHANCYTADEYPLYESNYDIAQGELSILEQYCSAIDAARRTVYIENQAIPIPMVAQRLDQALRRGVEVIILVPPPSNQLADVQSLAPLYRHNRFMLSGIAGRDAQGMRHPVYVHAKTMLIDDCWATIGSCNLHSGSMSGHSELNASIWSPEFVHALRCELFAEHLQIDTSHLDDLSAFELYRTFAEGNATKHANGDLGWNGNVIRLDPGSYGT